MSPVNSRSPPPLPPPPLTAPKVLARGALNRVDCRPSKSLRNSGRSSRHGTKSTCCSFASSCNGRTRVTVFLWWKKVVMARRMPFRSTVDESNPGCGLSAVSKYSSGVMASPSSSLRSSAKSRTTHTKEGKNRRSSPAAAAAATPCSSPLPLPLLLLLLLLRAVGEEEEASLLGLEKERLPLSRWPTSSFTSARERKMRASSGEV
mmetsp:Transcript_67870/g.133145  ORF Transcript_67870/g.133145 Transcript_67870/m.133145 type:complete len:205 (-) Transcript_67870:387-1001(-)